MGIGTGSAAIIGGIGAAGSLGAAALGSSAANKAASTQAQAANQAAQLQYQAQQDALNFQKQQWATQQQELAPWLQAGSGALGQLSSLTSTPGQGLLASYGKQFSAPTMQDALNDPGYQFGLQQGVQALDRSAAAKGTILNGGTAKALQRYGNDYATTKYDDLFNRTLGTYQTNYNVWANDQANTYNRLAGLSGAGQTAANTLGQLGQNAANSVSNTLLVGANNQANSIQNAAAARASGYVGSANAWANGVGGMNSSLMNLLLFKNLYGGGGGGSSSTYIPGVDGP